MTEFEEITLKKIIKGKIVDEYYVNLNAVLGRARIGNNELSRKIGWDPAGYNQKLNRLSDLRFSTLVIMFVAIMNLENEKNECKLTPYEEYEEIELSEVFTYKQFQLGKLFLHVSAAAEGRESFLNTTEVQKTFKSLRTYVMGKRPSPQLSDKEKEVYLKYYNSL